ncbi:hypothetical protein [Clostridium estertheticum]
MFREMRRKNQLLFKEETIEILQVCTSGVLVITRYRSSKFIIL